jgi:hypothetical protein
MLKDLVSILTFRMPMNEREQWTFDHPAVSSVVSTLIVGALTVLHPDPDAARAALARAGFTVDIERADAPSLRAEIVTLAGERHVLS